MGKRQNQKLRRVDMKINRIDIVMIGIFALTGIYLFIQAPEKLKDEVQQGELIPVKRLFDIVAHENNVARELWTKKIVVAGKKSGFKFGEDWKDEGVEKGPLPALFLREVSNYLEKSPVALSLFLGSDFPIAIANKFEGKQVEVYQNVKTTNEPQYFYDDSVNRYTAMYPDYAISKACVTCHNEHKESPKKDWKFSDMMGATTWSYPNEYVTRDELAKVLSTVRGSFAKTYKSFLIKLETFENPPSIGEKWPEDGYKIPDLMTFHNQFSTLSSSKTLEFFLKEDIKDQNKTSVN